EFATLVRSCGILRRRPLAWRMVSKHGPDRRESGPRQAFRTSWAKSRARRCERKAEFSERVIRATAGEDPWKTSTIRGRTLRSLRSLRLPRSPRARAPIGAWFG